jgi:hypothetical protein
MDMVLRDLTARDCYVFVDDIIIFAYSLQEHSQRLEDVLQRFEQSTLLLQPSKGVFGLSAVHYLSYTISRDGIMASPDKVKAVIEYPVPKSVRDVKACIRLASFYRRLIPKFAELAKPLTGLIRENAKLEWGEPQQAAFDKVKGILCFGQLLVYHDFSKPFLHTTDTSKVTVAAVLSQEHDSINRHVAFASQAERNYSASEKEMLGVIWSTKLFRSYLYRGRFLLNTDNSAVTHLRNFADNNARHTRWALRPAGSEFDIVLKPGTLIRHVDALSRHINLVTITQAPSKNQVRSEQLKDKFYSTRVIGKLKDNLEYFRDIDGVICRRSSDGIDQLPFSAFLSRAIIALNQEQILAAHPGRRTLGLMCLSYYWTGMKKDIEQFLKECDECQRSKRTNEYRAPPAEEREELFPFDVKSLDITAPYAETSRKYLYLLTFLTTSPAMTKQYRCRIFLPNMC